MIFQEAQLNKYFSGQAERRRGHKKTTLNKDTENIQSPHRMHPVCKANLIFSRFTTQQNLTLLQFNELHSEEIAFQAVRGVDWGSNISTAEYENLRFLGLFVFYQDRNLHFSGILLSVMPKTNNCSW